MNSLERAGQNLLAAHRRSPLAVMPGHVLSPMDTETTVGISRALIEDCQREVDQTDPVDPFADAELRRAAAGPSQAWRHRPSRWLMNTWLMKSTG